MSRYFDKDFFKFLAGFMVIIVFSMIIILAAQLYRDQESQVANVIQAVTPKQ